MFRAFANFQLVTLWGTAPLVKHTLSESEYMQPNSTPDSLWAAVETDLKEAINSGALTQKASVNQPTARVTKQFAQAMLGKAQLFQKKYAEAARTLDEVINSKLYILNPDLSNQGTPDGDNSVESLFEVNLPFDTNNSNENSYFKFLLLDGAAAMISVPVWVGMGHYGAQSREDLARWMSNGQHLTWLIVGIVILAVVIIVIKNKKKAKKEEEEAKSKS